MGKLLEIGEKSTLFSQGGRTVTVNPSAFKLPDRPLNENLILDLTEWVIDLTERIIPNSKNKKSEILKRLCEQFYFDDGRLQQCDVAGTA